MSPRRIQQVTLLILILGGAASLAVYLTTEPVTVDPLLGRPLSTKKFVHELRVIGGEANVMMAELQEWFAERWQGRNLAGTLAVLTVVGALTFRFFARHPHLLRPDRPAADSTKANPP